MKRKELKNILNLIMNEDMDLAKENLIRVLNEDTDFKKEKYLKDIENAKDEISAGETFNLTEKEEDINDVASKTAMDDIENQPPELSPDMASDVDPNSVDPNDVNYRLNDIKFDIEDLKRKFDELMNSEPTTDPNDDTTSEDESSNTTEENNNSDVDNDSNDIDYTLENIISQDLVSSLLEEYSGIKVDAQKNNDGLSVGNNEIIKQNDISPLTKEIEQFKDLETSATPIEIKNSDSPKGYDREKSPEVHGNGIDAINKIDVHEVPKNGSKDALLNSNKGFGGKDSKSPIPGN